MVEQPRIIKRLLGIIKSLKEIRQRLTALEETVQSHLTRHENDDYAASERSDYNCSICGSDEC